MQKNKPIIVLFTLVIISLVGFACQIPAIGQDQEPALSGDTEATLAALQTAVAENQTELSTPELPLPSETLQPAQTSAAYRGFMVYHNGRFIAYDFSGNPLGLDLPAGVDTYYNDSEVSVTADAVYYSQFSDSSGVYRVDAQGTQKLDFIDGGTDPVSIAVSPDGSKISWSTSSWDDSAPETQIYMANIDGSDQRLVSERTAAQQQEYWLIYHPYRWNEDGSLLYATGLTGIGGYILFWGYNGMFEYNPETLWNRTLIPNENQLGLGLSGISHNREMAAVIGYKQRVGIVQVNTGDEIQIPELDEQNSAGSVRFSTDDTWVAYVIQTNNYEDERGKVVVVPVDGSQEPRIVASFNNGQMGTFTVESWVDTETFLVTKYDYNSDSSSVWLMSRDGNIVQELVAGDFIGLYP